MRKLLLSATFLVSLSLTAPGLAAESFTAKVSNDDFTTITNLVNGYLGAAPVDTTTFEGGSVVNITPVLEQVEKTLSGYQVTDADQQKYIKERPAYISSDDYTTLSKKISAALTAAANPNGRVDLAAVSRTIDATLSIAQVTAQVTPTSLQAAMTAEDTAMRAYVKAMRASGGRFKMSRQDFLAWAKANGYSLPGLTYLGKAALDAKFVVKSTDATTATTATGATATGTAATGTAATGTTATTASTGTTTGSATTATGTSGATTGTGTATTGAANSGATNTGTAGSAGTASSTTTPTTVVVPAGISTVGAVSGTSDTTAAATAALEALKANPQTVTQAPTGSGTSSGTTMSGLTGTQATGTTSSTSGSSTTGTATVDPTSLGTVIGSQVGSQVSSALGAAASGMQ
jgi:hypothetical protein